MANGYDKSETTPGVLGAVCGSLSVLLLMSNVLANIVFIPVITVNTEHFALPACLSIRILELSTPPSDRACPSSG
jgi:hypothetical protein